jgi:ankyrin repeat protein
MNRIDQELLEATGENNLPEVRRLLSIGADVNAKDNWHDRTPLHVACEKGHVQVVKELVEHGADVDVKDKDGSSPLHWACAKGHLAVVNELLSRGANIEVEDIDGNTPLHLACANCHVAVVNELLSRGANIEAQDRYGDTPLHDASWNGHVAIVKALLSSGANIRAANNDRNLPIDRAVRCRKSVVSKYLLQHFYATIIGRLPLHDLLKDLTWKGNPYSYDAPPLRAALHDNVLGTDDVVDILESLVERNSALLSSRDPDGSLPLHVACRRGASFSVVQSLVELYKASVKSVTSEGDLPLFLACELPEPSLDTIFLLIKLYPDLVYR